MKKIIFALLLIVISLSLVGCEKEQKHQHSYTPEVVDPTCNIIFGAGIDENMSDEVEITVIATGFNNATYTDEMREEVKRSIVDLRDENQELTGEEDDEVSYESEEDDESSIETLDDSDIPPFIRNRLKNKRR